MNAQRRRLEARQTQEGRANAMQCAMATKVRAPEDKGTEKTQDKEKRDEQSNMQCDMRSVKTGPDPESHEYYYKVIALRCDKV